MKLLVVGGGGREHAIIKKLKENPAVETIYALPGNGGIAADAVCVDINAKDIPAQVAFAKSHGVDYAVVAPDDPLALGAGRPDPGGDPLLRPQCRCRADRKQQGLCQGPDEEIPHPHRRL